MKIAKNQWKYLISLLKACFVVNFFDTQISKKYIRWARIDPLPFLNSPGRIVYSRQRGDNDEFGRGIWEFSISKFFVSGIFGNPGKPWIVISCSSSLSWSKPEIKCQKIIFSRKIFLFFFVQKLYSCVIGLPGAKKHARGVPRRPEHFQRKSIGFQGSRVSDSTFPGSASFYFVADCRSSGTICIDAVWMTRHHSVPKHPEFWKTIKTSWSWRHFSGGIWKKLLNLPITLWRSRR